MCMYIYVKRKYQYRHPPISSISCLYLFLSYNVIHLPIPKKNKAPTDSNPLNFPSFSSLFLSRFPKHQGVAQHAPCQLRQLRLQLSPQLLQLRRRHGTSGRLRSSARRIWNDRGLPLTWRGSKATKGGSKLRKTWENRQKVGQKWGENWLGIKRNETSWEFFSAGWKSYGVLTQNQRLQPVWLCAAARPFLRVAGSEWLLQCISPPSLSATFVQAGDGSHSNLLFQYDICKGNLKNPPFCTEAQLPSNSIRQDRWRWRRMSRSITRTWAELLSSSILQLLTRQLHALFPRNAQQALVLHRTGTGAASHAQRCTKAPGITNGSPTYMRWSPP